jgi:hypothetical protein
MNDLLTTLKGIRTGQQYPLSTLSLEERAVPKGLDPEAVVERAAIMEYDGGLPRDIAELCALGERNINDDGRVVKR